MANSAIATVVSIIGTAHARNGPEQVLGEVDAVNGHVVQVAGAGGVLVLPPAPARLGPIQEALRAKVSRLTQPAGAHQMSKIAH